MLYIRQWGTDGVLIEDNYFWDIRAVCPVNRVSARLGFGGAEEIKAWRVDVYPNPVSQEFTVAIEGAKNESVRLFMTNLSGQVVVDKRVMVRQSTHSEQLALPGANPGLYLLRVSMANLTNTPDWNIPNKSQITIEQLLQRNAGMFDVDNDPVSGFNGESYVNYVLSRDSTHQFTAEEMLKPIIDNQLKYFDPTTGYHYSNTGYVILSRIIERVYSARSGSAKTYADYLYDHITGPASWVPLPISFPYLANDVQLPQPNVASLLWRPSGQLDSFGRVNMSAHVGEGNGYSTMASLNTYVRSLMRGQNVLQPQTVKLLQTDVSVARPTYGLGTSLFTNLGYGHNGAIAGYLSQWFTTRPQRCHW